MWHVMNKNKKDRSFMGLGRRGNTETRENKGQQYAAKRGFRGPRIWRAWCLGARTRRTEDTAAVAGERRSRRAARRSWLQKGAPAQFFARSFPSVACPALPRLTPRLRWPSCLCLAQPPLILAPAAMSVISSLLFSQSTKVFAARMPIYVLSSQLLANMLTPSPLQQLPIFSNATSASASITPPHASL